VVLYYEASNSIQQVFDILVIVNIGVPRDNKKMLCPPFKPQPALHFTDVAFLTQLSEFNRNSKGVSQPSKKKIPKTPSQET